MSASSAASSISSAGLNRVATTPRVGRRAQPPPGAIAPRPRISISKLGPLSTAVEAAVALQVHDHATSDSTLTYRAAQLPAGLSIDAATGLITGNPTTVGPGTVKLTITGASGAGVSTSFSWTITGSAGPAPTQSTTPLPTTAPTTPAPAPIAAPPTTPAPTTPAPTTAPRTTAPATPRSPSKPPTTLPVYTVTIANPGNRLTVRNSAVSLQLNAAESAGAALSYRATGLPAGLSINPGTGLISGTPTAAGSSPVTVTATDGAGAYATAAFTWTITQPAISAPSPS